MSRTRTGQFSIGLRRFKAAWQNDLFPLIDWAGSAGFEALDLGRDGDVNATLVASTGMKVGSVDLAEWQGLISPDACKREEAIQKNSKYIEACAKAGSINHFMVMLPEKSELPREKNFEFMVESINRLSPVLEKAGARIVVEGWPGPGALCCTPEGYRALIEACPSPSIGINYDPSHLIRMGIDSIRFLREFASRIYHVHGKDTELLTENQYEYGTEQPATFSKPVRFGGMCWRYTIPGHGCTRWVEIFRILENTGYSGCVSVELEDASFNGTETGEKSGLIQSLQFLSGC